MEDGSKPRDLEDRTFEFAQSVRTFVKQLPRTISNTEDVRQLVRASGSVAANWIEADEALSKKDFLMRVKICRKESKESRLFLRVVDAGLAKSNVSARDELAAEARELTLIFHRLSRRADNCPAFFWDLTIEFFLGFGNWDLELMRQHEATLPLRCDSVAA
jgi:four helix bundle protein